MNPWWLSTSESIFANTDKTKTCGQCTYIFTPSVNRLKNYTGKKKKKSIMILNVQTILYGSHSCFIYYRTVKRQKSSHTPWKRTDVSSWLLKGIQPG